jgi:hypothetical protein
MQPITLFPELMRQRIPMACLPGHLPEDARSLAIRAREGLVMFDAGVLGKKMPEISVPVDVLLMLFSTLVASAYQDSATVRQSQAMERILTTVERLPSTPIPSEDVRRMLIGIAMDIDSSRSTAAQGVGHVYTWTMPSDAVESGFWPEYDCKREMVTSKLQQQSEPSEPETPADNIIEFPKDAGVRERTTYPSQEDPT